MHSLDHNKGWLPKNRSIKLKKKVLKLYRNLNYHAQFNTEGRIPQPWAYTAIQGFIESFSQRLKYCASMGIPHRILVDQILQTLEDIYRDKGEIKFSEGTKLVKSCSYH